MSAASLIRNSRCAKHRRGLTLLELLLALGLFALLMVAINTFVFSMGELWGRGAKERLFKQHARAVTHFLDRSFRESTLTSAFEGARAVEPAPATGGQTQQGQQQQQANQAQAQTGTETPTVRRVVRWAKPPADDFKPHLLTFELTEPPTLLPFPSTPLPHLTLQLELREGEGLWLLWNSALEKREDDKPPKAHETQVSPHIVGIIYDYYDPEAKTWSSEDKPKNGDAGDPVVPDRIRLKFKMEDEETETTVSIPAAPQGGRTIF
jgi:prepilin-type N-terminal cleavage/methylation domain-containing protein